MSLPTLKKLVVVLFVIIVIGVAILAFVEPSPAPVQEEQIETTPLEVITEAVPFSRHSVIGNSVYGRPIEAYTFGTGEKHVLFVGGIHGGYEWNSVLLAYALIDHFEVARTDIPKNLTVTVIPSANPDGVFEIVQKEGRFTPYDIPTGTNTTGKGRFNMNNVDLNRNFACKWQPKSTWKGEEVNAGSEAFSEPEARAIRDYVASVSPSAVVFFHSQSNAVYASECLQGVLPATTAIMNVYARAAGYEAVESFDAYPITGDAEGWLASINIPAITVELATHESIEWDKNLAGVKALLNHLSL